MRMFHRTLTTAVSMMFLVMVSQVAESAQWPRSTKYGLQCLKKSHCQSKIYNGEPAVCRRKVNSKNRWVSKKKYCLKALWDGAPCDNPDQCSSGICDDRKCSKKVYAKEVKTYTAEDATKPSLSDLDNLKNDLIEELNKLRSEIENLKKSQMCHWNGHDRILIKPRDFSQVSGEDHNVHTNYFDGGGAVEAHDNFDLLAQYTIPKNCTATKVVISLNQDCTGFEVLTSKLLHKKADKVFEGDINSKTHLIGIGWVLKSQNLTDGQFTMVSTNLPPMAQLSESYDKLGYSNVLSIRILDKDHEDDWFLADPWNTLVSYLHAKAMQAYYDQDHCDVSGGYIKLEPVAGDSASNTQSNNSTQQTPATKKKKLSAIDQGLLGKKKPIKTMVSASKPKTPIAISSKPKLVAVSASQTCGKGQTFEPDCVGKNACRDLGGSGWVVGNIHQPISTKKVKGVDYSLGQGHTYWQNHANKCALLAVKKPKPQTCNYSYNCDLLCKCQKK